MSPSGLTSQDQLFGLQFPCRRGQQPLCCGETIFSLQRLGVLGSEAISDGGHRDACLYRQRLVVLVKMLWPPERSAAPVDVQMDRTVPTSPWRDPHSACTRRAGYLHEM